LCERCKWKRVGRKLSSEEEWRKYMGKLLNEENTWNNATTCER